jgi:acetylornithine/N-succinyldiaminopimelate aminotransferase
LLKPGFLETVKSSGNYLSEKLKAASAELDLGEERGIGLLRALELKADIGAKVVTIARDNGLLLNSPRPAVLRFMPALNVSREEIDQMIAGMKSAIKAARA